MRYVLIVAIFLTACASAETRRNGLQTQLDSHLGKPVEALLADVGAPTRSVPKGPPGELLYVYDWPQAGPWCSITYVVAQGIVKSAFQSRCY